jgi:hypothetical protein
MCVFYKSKTQDAVKIAKAVGEISASTHIHHVQLIYKYNVKVVTENVQKYTAHNREYMCPLEQHFNVSARSLGHKSMSFIVQATIH